MSRMHHWTISEINKLTLGSICSHYRDIHCKELRAAFEKIYNKGASTLSFEHLYRNVYNLVLHRYGGKLYEVRARPFAIGVERRPYWQMNLSRLLCKVDGHFSHIAIQPTHKLALHIPWLMCWLERVPHNLESPAKDGAGARLRMFYLFVCILVIARWWFMYFRYTCCIHYIYSP